MAWHWSSGCYADVLVVMPFPLAYVPASWSVSMSFVVMMLFCSLEIDLSIAVGIDLVCLVAPQDTFSKSKENLLSVVVVLILATKYDCWTIYNYVNML